MENFTGWQYMLIDLANAFGLDKKLFGERIQWAEANLLQLETMVEQADNKPMFIKAVMDIRKVQRGEPTGHLVELDACCSGIQVMSALTGCVAGATATGLVDPNVRADAYGVLQGEMSKILGNQFAVDRGDAKQAMMTMFYGSKKEPINIFGENTPEISAFYQASQTIAPGAFELLQDLLGSWQPNALEHCWKLPDGFDVRVKVMEKISTRIEVDELDHSTFTYEYKVNQGKKSGLSNAANVVHSVDAYVLRCIHRRCNYDQHTVEKALDAIYSALLNRNGKKPTEALEAGTKLAYYVGQYVRSGMTDIVIVNHITHTNVHQLDTTLLEKLRDIVISMLAHKPFPVVSIHDAFKCGPNHMNHLRQHYINIFAELADSNVLSDILSQIHGRKGVFPKLSNNLSQLIRGSNYALS